MLRLQEDGRWDALFQETAANATVMGCSPSPGRGSTINVAEVGSRGQGKRPRTSSRKRPSGSSVSDTHKRQQASGKVTSAAQPSSAADLEVEVLYLPKFEPRGPLLQPQGPGQFQVTPHDSAGVAFCSAKSW